jgi:hypothetical protein
MYELNKILQQRKNMPIQDQQEFPQSEFLSKPFNQSLLN